MFTLLIELKAIFKKCLKNLLRVIGIHCKVGTVLLGLFEIIAE